MLISVTGNGKGAKGVDGSEAVEGAIGARGVLPSFGTAWVPFTTVAGSDGTTGEGVTPATGAETGVEGAAASGVGVDSACPATGVTAAAAAVVDDVDESPDFVSAAFSPWLMIITFSSLGFNAPYKANPPTPASKALWNVKYKFWAYKQIKKAYVCSPLPLDFCCWTTG